MGLAYYLHITYPLHTTTHVDTCSTHYQVYRSVLCAHVTRPRPTPDHFRPLYRKLTALPARASDSSTRVLKRACSGSPEPWAADMLSLSGTQKRAALHAAAMPVRASKRQRVR